MLEITITISYLNIQRRTLSKSKGISKSVNIFKYHSGNEVYVSY